MGKDILAVLIGVFGTITGFYFGTEKAGGAAARRGDRRRCPVRPTTDKITRER